MNNTEDSATKKRRSSPVRQNVRRQPRRHSTIDALPASLSLKCAVCHARIRFRTVKAIAHGANGKRLVINCLLYRGAEQTLVTEDRARALGLVGVAETVIVKGIGGIHCTPTLARRVGFRLSLVKSVPVRCGDWKHLQHLRIAKEQDEKLPVHVLISVDSYGRFLDEKILRASTFQYRCHCAQIEDNMEQLLKKFWELKSIGIQHQEEKMTQDLVSDQFHRTLAYDGLRYSVGLLWKPGEIWLPDNRPLAEHRLQAVIRKDPVKRLEYTAVIGEYLRNGWAEEVTRQNEQIDKIWYLPHH
ncbi:hypothetical protein Tsp_01095 [Trichinella spiralis]|uniref:hypothetical protein n=1 Tax=Trichinella spiralis TaxID=6334 RepID=UPI0001EFC077|nr:hypothetical protein Tsp_01095 [Trichinella spiralis]